MDEITIRMPRDMLHGIQTVLKGVEDLSSWWAKRPGLSEEAAADDAVQERELRVEELFDQLQYVQDWERVLVEP